MYSANSNRQYPGARRFCVMTESPLSGELVVVSLHAHSIDPTASGGLVVRADDGRVVHIFPSYVEAWETNEDGPIAVEDVGEIGFDDELYEEGPGCESATFGPVNPKDVN